MLSLRISFGLGAHKGKARYLEKSDKWSGARSQNQGEDLLSFLRSRLVRSRRLRSISDSIEPNFDCKSNVFRRSMDRFGGSLSVKGYSGEMAGKKRVQLPVDLGKGRRLVFIFSL